MSPEDLLAQYENLKLADANEAETRLKIIDAVLFDVLGWTHDDVSVEERTSEDGKDRYSDYKISTAITALLVEAKRIGSTFDDVPNKRKEVISRLLRTNAKNAIIQARDTARSAGIQYACATNGAQWIVFPAIRIDEVEFEKSSAIIFPSLKSILEENYQEFFDLLSRDSVLNNSLDSELLGRVKDQIEERRLNRFVQRISPTSHNTEFYHLIDEPINIAFNEDIANTDPAILEKCYVSTPSRIRFDKRIKMHLVEPNIAIKPTPARPLKGSGTRHLSEILKEAIPKTKPTAILLVGPVGSGKTTFLRYTKEVAGTDIFEQSPSEAYPHWVAIDFRDMGPDENPVDFIYRMLQKYIDSDSYLSNYDRCLKYAYKERIDSLFRGPLSLLADDESVRKREISDLLRREYTEIRPYVDTVLSYASSNTKVFLVIDNVDQFDKNDEQERIFADAMAVARRLFLNLILSVRESTYVRQRSLPIFDAFDFETIAIDPPNVKSVLSKRFLVAETMLLGRSGDFTAENGAKIHVEDLSMLIGILRDSVLGSKIGDLIDVFSTGDIRNALRMTREFLRNGYTAPGRAVRITQSGQRYIMPQHEALRAIILGNRPVYEERYSSVANVFDSRLSQSSAQLLRLFILAGLASAASDPSFRGMPGEDIKAALNQIGIGDHNITAVLEDMCQLRLIYTTGKNNPSLQSDYIPSRFGGYTVRELIGDLVYVENVLFDTFISDDIDWTRIRELTEKIQRTRQTVARLKLRIERSRIFLESMAKNYSLLQEEALRRALPPMWLSNPISDGTATFERSATFAMQSAKRNYQNTGNK